MSTDTKSTGASFGTWAVIAALVFVAFFASYRFAAANSARVSADVQGVATALDSSNGFAVASTDGSAGSTAGCACCGGGGPSTPIEGSATVEGDVQRISVDVSQGFYDPNTIKLVAGVPAEITFSQSSGCTGEVLSQDLGFYEDLNSGAKTVKLPALTPGTYSFSCGMQMVFGTIVVE